MNSLDRIENRVDKEIAARLKEYRRTRSPYLDGFMDGLARAVDIVNDNKCVCSQVAPITKDCDCFCLECWDEEIDTCLCPFGCACVDHLTGRAQR